VRVHPVEIVDNDFALDDALPVGAEDGDQQHQPIVARTADRPNGERSTGLGPRATGFRLRLACPKETSAFVRLSLALATKAGSSPSGNGTRI
jgi:hypothetical protein